MNSDDKPATKGDVKEIVSEVVTRVIGSATTEILTAVGEQLHTMNEQIDEHFDLLEVKVDNVTDDHAQRISKLEKQRA